MRRALSLFAMAVVAAAVTPPAIAQATYADEDRDWGIAPTQQLRRPPYHGPTPRGIPGAQVLKTAELKAMMETAAPPLAIDVASGAGHDSVRNAVWLDGAGHVGSRAGGRADFIDAIQARLADDLARLSGGDKSRALVFFCVDSECWLSYNTALRAAALGYTRVYWYRGGIEAWRAAGLPLAPLRPARAGAAAAR